MTNKQRETARPETRRTFLRAMTSTTVAEVAKVEAALSIGDLAGLTP
jgi:hypothetical protein